MAIARDLGVSLVTLRRWVTRRRPPRFRKVELARDRSEVSGAVLVTPSGFRVEGLDIAGMAALIRALS